MWLALWLGCSDPPAEAPKAAPAAEAPVPSPVASPTPSVPATEGTPTPTENPPPPFTADQIRDGMPKGTQIGWRFVMGDKEADGEWRVRDADADGMTLEVLPEGTTNQTPWEELPKHATFASAVVETDVPLTTGLGELTTTRYTVVQDGKTLSFWFSPKHPGPPVKHTIQVGDQTTFHMEQTARDVVDPASWEPPG